MSMLASGNQTLKFWGTKRIIVTLQNNGLTSLSAKITLSFVRAVPLATVSQLAHFDALSRQKSGQIVLEDVWIHFVSSR
jgi:hypothetical protein